MKRCPLCHRKFSLPYLWRHIALKHGLSLFRDSQPKPPYHLLCSICRAGFPLGADDRHLSPMVLHYAKEHRDVAGATMLLLLQQEKWQP